MSGVGTPHARRHHCAEARFRDWDGDVRKVTATGPTVKAAKQALRQKLARRSTATGFGAALTPDSSVAELATAWLKDVQVRTDLRGHQGPLCP